MFNLILHGLNFISDNQTKSHKLKFVHAPLVFYYRPQRSCGKVMFLHLSVSHSVHRGLCLSMHLPVQVVSVQGGLCPGGSLLRGSLSRGSLSGGLCPEVSVQGGFRPEGVIVHRGSLSRGVSVYGGGDPVWESLSGGVSAQGVSVWGVSLQGVSVRETPPRQRPPIR